MRLNPQKFMCAILAICCPLLSLVPFSGAQAAADAPREPAHTDLMLICTHPGDEFFFFGGVLSNYVGQQGMKASVVYLAQTDQQTRSYTRAAMAVLGTPVETVFGTFPDLYTDTLKNAETYWDPNEVTRYMVEQIRRLRPAIIVTHDSAGEFGHGMHQLVASCAVEAVKQAAQSTRFPRSAKEYGAWQPLRLFLHLSAESPVSLDRAIPLSNQANMTALELDRLAYSQYPGTMRLPYQISDDSLYNRADYGLVYAASSLKLTPPTENDLFSGLDTALYSGANPDKIPRSASSVPTVPDQMPAPASSDIYYRKATDPTEVVVIDEEKEHWEYRTDTLSILVDRYHVIDADQKPICYQIAHIRMREVDAFRPGLSDNLHRLDAPWQMARRYRAVLAIAGDNLTRAEADKKGILIRDGQVYNKNPRRDTLALYPDLTMQIHLANTVTVDELLSAGVKNSFSFGPTMIYDGVVQDLTRATDLGRFNPRGGIGYIEPGHFVVITVDGRQRYYSQGITLTAFAHLFYYHGCLQAYNLDGGSSVAMVFMGEHLNQHRGEGSDVQRPWVDALMWGESDLVPDEKDPVKNPGELVPGK